MIKGMQCVCRYEVKMSDYHHVIRDNFVTLWQNTVEDMLKTVNLFYVAIDKYSLESIYEFLFYSS